MVDPVASYRLQLTPTFGFGAAAGVLDHIERLGVSHVYLSPIAEAVAGSSHGYDVVDHTTVRAEFGGAEGFEALLDAVAARSMAVLFDHVPNHVSSARPEQNQAWWQLLRDGRDSPAADWFDVEWELADDRVILPVLGAPLADVIRSGDLTLEGDSLLLYGERRLPIAAGTDTLPLSELVGRQHYRMIHWRDPARNVRRFFTIDDLVAVRVEHQHVAAVVDTLPERYAAHPGFGGVRVDHVDGLANPKAYLEGLRQRVGDGAWLLVEKILGPGEDLPADWPVDGTTGYEFIRQIDHVLLNDRAGVTLTARWAQDSGDNRTFHELEHEARLEVVDTALRPDLERVQRLANASIDGDHDDQEAELRRLTTELDRYRTYSVDDSVGAELIGEISQGPVAEAMLHPQSVEHVELRARWQQLTGPVMAKGAEDRSFYRYLRLASLCEVGGSPGSFGLDTDEFHGEQVARHERWPRNMLASSTHDTKRSEDVRALSGALTWSPTATRSLAELSAGISRATGLDGVASSLLAQTVLTCPGLTAERLTAYVVKAMREAALSTTWEDPDADYEALLERAGRWAIESGAGLPHAVARLGAGLSVAATVLRCTSPGVPDIYQGTEVASFRLVDPDNRVEPDWSALREAPSIEIAHAWRVRPDVVKAPVIAALLSLRRRRAGSFGARGGYFPIDLGKSAIAFRRADDVIVVVVRGIAGELPVLELPPGDWLDVLHPERGAMRGPVRLDSIVGGDGLPAAALERVSQR